MNALQKLNQSRKILSFGANAIEGLAFIGTGLSVYSYYQLSKAIKANDKEAINYWLQTVGITLTVSFGLLLTGGQLENQACIAASAIVSEVRHQQILDAIKNISKV